LGRPGKCGLLTGLYKPPPFVILVIARSQPQSDRLRGHDELDREVIVHNTTKKTEAKR